MTGAKATNFCRMRPPSIPRPGSRISILVRGPRSKGDWSFINRNCLVVWTTTGKMCSIANATRINPGIGKMQHL